jgi:hypothetical protein
VAWWMRVVIFLSVLRKWLGIQLFPVIFNDNDGKWCLNFCYVKPSLGHNHFFARDRAELKIIAEITF